MKKLYITLQMLLMVSMAIAQNWTNVGSPSFSNGTTSSSFLYFGDMEVDAAGNVFVGYWDYGGKCNFAKNTGGSWTILPSPGSFAVSADDIEVHGTDYYYSYLGVRSGNYYAFVKKYDGSSSWAFVGDSILIGGVGQGGNFDFLVDNNGVPTIIGLPKTVFGNKTVKQFKNGAWSTTCVIPNSASTLFKDGSSIFDSDNKLNCVISGLKTLGVPPYALYYVTDVKISDSTTTIVGDTVYSNSANPYIRIDNTGNSYLMFNGGPLNSFLSYKLNGTKWDMVSDTAGYVAAAIGAMLYADVSNDGKIIFCSQTFTAFQKSLFKYDGGVRSKMDTLNFNSGIIAGISDIIIHGTDVYVLFVEGGFTVMKHSVNGGSSAVNNLSAIAAAVNIYPNPAKDHLIIDLNESDRAGISIKDINGKLVLETEITKNNNTIEVNTLNQGIYFVQVITENGTLTRKLVIEN